MVLAAERDRSSWIPSATTTALLRSTCAASACATSAMSGSVATDSSSGPVIITSGSMSGSIEIACGSTPMPSTQITRPRLRASRTAPSVSCGRCSSCAGDTEKTRRCRAAGVGNSSSSCCGMESMSTVTSTGRISASSADCGEPANTIFCLSRGAFCSIRRAARRSASAVPIALPARPRTCNSTAASAPSDRRRTGANCMTTSIDRSSAANTDEW